MTTDRRRFLATTGAVAVTLTAAPNVIAQPKVQWRMSTSWPPRLDVLLGAAQRFAKVVEEVSAGRFRIEVFPGGQIMPDFACFDAASQGTIEAFHSGPIFWDAKEPGGVRAGVACEGRGGLRRPVVATMATSEEVRSWARWAFGS